MKIYTHYSRTHEELYNDFFLKTLRNIYSKKELPVRALNHEQTTESGSFMEPGWLEAMDYKLLVILKAIEECMGSWFVFADCDIQFFNPFLDDIGAYLKKNDLACQEDRGSLCAGFFACNATEKTKILFQSIRSHFRGMVNDQAALNNFSYLTTNTLLDTKKYFTIGNVFTNIGNNTHEWDGKAIILPPKEILIHHANYVRGTADKIRLMNLIRENYITKNYAV
jgi:hypothetical protein